MPDPEPKPATAPVIVNKPADKAGVIHHTPLQPGMSMKDLRPDDTATDEERESALALKKRIAAVKIVPQLPDRPKLRLVVATAKDGLSAEVLYIGFDAAKARAALVFNESHRHVELFETPTKRVRANLSDVVHHTPFKPGDKRVEPKLEVATVDQDLKRFVDVIATSDENRAQLLANPEITLKLLAALRDHATEFVPEEDEEDEEGAPKIPPANFLEQEEAKRLAAIAAGSLSSSPQIVSDRVNRKRSLEGLGPGLLQDIAEKLGLDVSAISAVEDRDLFIDTIVDKELPLPPSNNAAGGDSSQQDAGGSSSTATLEPDKKSDKKPKGLGK